MQMAKCSDRLSSSLATTTTNLNTDCDFSVDVYSRYSSSLLFSIYYTHFSRFLLFLYC